MIKTKFKIDMYDWDVYYIEVEKKDKPKKILKAVESLLGKIDLKICDYWKYKIEHGYVDGANCSHNTDFRTGIIFFYEVTKNGKHKLKNMCHEVRHLVDAIRKFHGLKGTEASAYLTGHIMGKLYKHL